MPHGIPNLTKPPGKKKIKKLLALFDAAREVEDIAESLGWDYWGWHDKGKIIKFKKRVHDEDIICKVWLNHAPDWYRVETDLRHPRKGYKKLLRDDCGLRTVESILQNPRAHTGLGKYIR